MSAWTAVAQVRTPRVATLGAGLGRFEEGVDMTVMPQAARPGEMSVRSKAVVRKVGGATVYVTKSRAVPVRLGAGKTLKRQELRLEGNGTLIRSDGSEMVPSVKVRVKPVKKAQGKAKTKQR